MKVICLFIALTACTLLIACKRDKTITYTGRLLFTRKNPQPIANRSIRLDQTGYGGAIGIPSGSTSSQATAQTDITGAFRLLFTPGTSTFLFFSSTNNGPLTLSGSYNDSSFAQFERTNFSDTTYNASQPIFIGKTIDTAIILVQLQSALLATDTIGFQAITTTRVTNREFTGRTGTAGSAIVLDTVYNMLFTRFNCLTKTYTNNLYAGRKYLSTTGTTYFSGTGYIEPFSLPETDQIKQEIKFFFRK